MAENLVDRIKLFGSSWLHVVFSSVTYIQVAPLGSWIIKNDVFSRLVCGLDHHEEIKSTDTNLHFSIFQQEIKDTLIFSHQGIERKQRCDIGDSY